MCTSLSGTIRIGALFGQDVAFPFLDRDLLAFLMAIPGEVLAWNGAPRGLAREAMRDVIPEAVYSRHGKADFSDFVTAGVGRDATCLAHVLAADSVGVKLGYFDAARLGPSVARLSGALTGADLYDRLGSGRRIWPRDVAETVPTDGRHRVMAQKKNRRRPGKRRPYQPPVLIRHGDLKTLTMTKGGTRTDGGSPKTRSGGAP